jgi:hypothetical protein
MRRLNRAAEESGRSAAAVAARFVDALLDADEPSGS